MKKILENYWPGSFLVNGEKKNNLSDWKPKEGEQIKIRLLAYKEENRTKNINSYL